MSRPIKHPPIVAGLAPSPVVSSAATLIGARANAPSGSPTGRTGAPNPPTHLVTCDASRVTPRGFLDFVTGDTPAKREQRLHEDRQRCIRAIEKGDTYGFPPVMVEECRKIMAESDVGWGLAERSAYGMVK